MFPESWRSAAIVPIPKPGKDSTELHNYIPVASQVVFVIHLNLYSESYKHISWFQSGFSSDANCNTSDIVVRLETCIRNAFTRKDHLVAMFFDFEQTHTIMIPLGDTAF